MKIKELIDNIDKSTKNEYTNIAWDLAGEVGLYDFDLDWEKEIKLRAYWLWNCTDTWVGYRVIYLGDELVATSYQECRKGNTKYYWISKYSYHKAVEYLKTIDISTADIWE